MTNKYYPKVNVDVLCYFVDENLSNDIICRVGRWKQLVDGIKRWHIHTDGKERYLHDIVQWQEIPTMKEDITHFFI